MCIILDKPAGTVFEESDIVKCGKMNPDGFGYMYYDPAQQRVISGRTLFKEPSELFETIKSLEKYHTVFHFRIRTVGDVSVKNCHPFKILDKQKHGQDLYFMHNGTISGLKEENNESDTACFARVILKPILKSCKRLLWENSLQLLISGFIGSSRLIFMDNKGHTLTFNKDKGTTYKGMWVSNDRPFEEPKQVYNYSKYHYDDDLGSYWSKYEKKEEAEKNKIQSVTALGTTLHLNDTVVVFNTEKYDYKQLGRVTEITSYSVSIQVKSMEKNEDVTLKFSTTSFDPWGCNPDYYFITTGKNIINFKTKLDEKEPEEKKEEPEEDTIDLIEKGPVTIPRLSFDPEEYRYGGNGYFDSESPYQEGVTIKSVYDMTPQKRLDFFLENPKIAFGMFQDLIEYLVLDDESYLEEGKDIEDEKIFSSRLN